MIRILSSCVALLLARQADSQPNDSTTDRLRGSAVKFQPLLKNHGLGHVRAGNTLVQGNCPVFDTIATTGEEKESFKDAARPCGYYSSQGCPYQVIQANVCYPGEGPGDIHTFVPYIVQFDIGLHPTVRAREYNRAEQFQKDWCIGCTETSFSDLGLHVTKESGETCMEIIVRAGDSSNDATVGGCAGKCGKGCASTGGGWAMDCLKHDVCVTYKKWVLEANFIIDMPIGFCNDLDCGDEAAHTVMNCYEDRWINDISRVCIESEFARDNDLYGHWSWSTGLFDEGRCGNYQDWATGQGIPDRSQISNPYYFDFIEYLHNQGVDVSAWQRQK